MVWFHSFLLLEAFFQFPVFVVGIYGLWKDSRSIYMLLALYGSSTATTTLACLAYIWSTPITSPTTLALGLVSVTSEQKMMLLSSYVPFFVVPLVMAVDMAYRVTEPAYKPKTE
jgi:hypothetical protein